MAEDNTPTNVVDDLAKQVDAQDIRIFFNEAYSKFDEKYMPWNYFENFLINEKKLSKDVAKEIISDIKTGLNKPEFLNFPDSILPSNIFPEAGNNFDTAVSQTLFRSPQVQRELSEKYIAVDTKDYLNLPLETQNELSSNFFEGINTQTTGNVEFYVQHQSINNIPANDIKQGFDMKFEIPGFYTEPIGNRQRNVIIGGGNNATINNYYKVQANTENLLIDISKGKFVGTKSPLVRKTKNILGTQINKIDWDIFTKETGITFEMLGESAKIIDGKKYYSDSVYRFTQTLKAANTESNVWEALKKSGIEGFVTGPNNVQYEIVFLDPNDNSNTGKKLNIQDATIQEFQANQAKVNQIDELIIDTPTNVVDYQDTGIGGRPLEIENGIPVDANSNPINSLGAADETITIYRVVPEGIDNVNANDWVFINKGQAEEALKNANTNSSDNFKIIELEVSKGDVYPSAKSGNLEMGYFPIDTPTNVVDDVVINKSEAIDNIDNLIDELPLEEAFKKQVKKNTARIGKNVATPGGILDFIDAWELGVLALGVTAIAAGEIDEIPTIMYNQGVKMYNNMLSSVGLPVRVEEKPYNINFEKAINTFNIAEMFMPTAYVEKAAVKEFKKGQEAGIDISVGLGAGVGVPPMQFKTEQPKEDTGNINSIMTNLMSNISNAQKSYPITADEIGTFGRNPINVVPEDTKDKPVKVEYDSKEKQNLHDIYANLYTKLSNASARVE